MTRDGYEGALLGDKDLNNDFGFRDGAEGRGERGGPSNGLLDGRDLNREVGGSRTSGSEKMQAEREAISRPERSNYSLGFNYTNQFDQMRERNQRDMAALRDQMFLADQAKDLQSRGQVAVLQSIQNHFGDRAKSIRTRMGADGSGNALVQVEVILPDGSKVSSGPIWASPPSDHVPSDRSSPRAKPSGGNSTNYIGVGWEGKRISLPSQPTPSPPSGSRSPDQPERIPEDRPERDTLASPSVSEFRANDRDLHELRESRGLLETDRTQSATTRPNLPSSKSPSDNSG